MELTLGALDVAFRTRCGSRIPEHAFDFLDRGCGRAVAFSDDELHLEAPSAFKAEWLEDKYGPSSSSRRSARTCVGRPIRFRPRLRPSPDALAPPDVRVESPRALAGRPGDRTARGRSRPARTIGNATPRRSRSPGGSRDAPESVPRILGSRTGSQRAVHLRPLRRRGQQPARRRRRERRRRQAGSALQPALPLRRRRARQDAPHARHRARSLLQLDPDRRVMLRVVRAVHERADRRSRNGTTAEFRAPVPRDGPPSGRRRAVPARARRARRRSSSTPSTPCTTRSGRSSLRAIAPRGRWKVSRSRLVSRFEWGLVVDLKSARLRDAHGHPSQEGRGRRARARRTRSSTASRTHAPSSVRESSKERCSSSWPYSSVYAPGDHSGRLRQRMLALRGVLETAGPAARWLLRSGSRELVASRSGVSVPRPSLRSVVPEDRDRSLAMWPCTSIRRSLGICLLKQIGESLFGGSRPLDGPLLHPEGRGGRRHGATDPGPSVTGWTTVRDGRAQAEPTSRPGSPPHVWKSVENRQWFPTIRRSGPVGPLPEQPDRSSTSPGARRKGRKLAS